MIKFVALIAGFVCLAIAGGFVFLIHEYNTVGFGLTPWVAWPCAVVMIVNAWFAFNFAAEN